MNGIRKIFLAVSILSFLMGCAEEPEVYDQLKEPKIPDQTYTSWTDDLPFCYDYSTLEPWIQNFVDAAADSWNSASGMGLFSGYDPDCTKQIIVGNIQELFPKASDSFIGIAYPDLIVIHSKLIESEEILMIQRVAAHEFGHWLHIGHLEDKTTLMNSELLYAVQPTAADIEALNQAMNTESDVSETP